MNAERLLAHFERISEAPDAIARLRRFILDLAVRGKLVEQDPEDEPAAELLAAISSESQQVKGRRKASPHSAGQVSDGPFGVPSSWEWTQLGAIGDWGSGSTPSRGRSDYYGGATSWFKSGELNDNKCLRESDEKITHLALEQCSFRLNSPGDLLIAMYGATIGKLAILGEEAVTNQAVCACTPCWGVDTEYLYLFLLAQRDEFRLASEGGAQPNISKVKIVNTPIPLPPLAEQHRIVAKVDQLMALCDQLEAARQQRQQGRERLLSATLQLLNQPAEDPASFRQDASFALQVLPSLTTTPAQIKQLRQTILSLAVRGKLVEQDPEDEPAEELLEIINGERRLLLMSGYPNADEARAQLKKQASVLEPMPPHWLPKGWAWTTLIRCSALVVDCRNKTAPYVSSGVPLVRTTNVKEGHLVMEDMRYVEEGIAKVWSSRCEPQSGDILITREAPMGEACIIPEDMRICLGQRMMLARMVPGTIFNRYILYMLRDPFLLDRVQDKPVGATVQHLRVGGVESLLVPLPPLAEQHRIVAKVDELMALCDQLEQQLSQADQQRGRLLEAVLAEALEEPEKALAAMT